MGNELIEQAKERLRLASDLSLRHYKKPLVVTYSGGKDSEAILQLAKEAGIPFEILHSHTTADAPETVRFVRKRLADEEGEGRKCEIQYPSYKGGRISMWTLIPIKLMPPTRMVRYCCEILKETGGADSFIATGVRWAESTKRLSRAIYERNHVDKRKRIFLNNDNELERRLFETCRLKGKRTVNPIIDWPDSLVWEYLMDRKCRTNPCYQMGLDRVGCVGCPLVGDKRNKEFAIWPSYKRLYLSAFARMIDERKKKGLKIENFDTAEDVMDWWLESNVAEGQIGFDEIDEEENE